MKPNQIKRNKLSLEKKSISNLNINQMQAMNGGQEQNTWTTFATITITTSLVPTTEYTATSVTTVTTTAQ